MPAMNLPSGPLMCSSPGSWTSGAGSARNRMPPDSRRRASSARHAASCFDVGHVGSALMGSAPSLAQGRQRQRPRRASTSRPRASAVRSAPLAWSAPCPSRTPDTLRRRWRDLRTWRTRSSLVSEDV
uniref:Uncharacterized protein n=1 Tax=uncultured marine virus TaxID=186617 RepID=A0A0F7L633_9VIRU|nr:hypothetical protein [uncultured marine virus]